MSLALKSVVFKKICYSYNLFIQFFLFPLTYDLVFLLACQFKFQCFFLRMRGVHWENAVIFDPHSFPLITVFMSWFMYCFSYNKNILDYFEIPPFNWYRMIDALKLQIVHKNNLGVTVNLNIVICAFQHFPTINCVTSVITFTDFQWLVLWNHFHTTSKGCCQAL